MYIILLLSALAFVISVFSFFYFRTYLRRRTGQERILSELREEVDNILSSIDKTTERDISLIEEREKKLKSLLEEIEKRLKVYIREIDRRRDAEETHAALAYQELGKNRYRSGAQGVPQPVEPAAAAPLTPNPAFPLPSFSVKPSGQAEADGTAATAASPPPVGEQIRELVRAGFAPPVIASRLGISITEVELATALLERRDFQGQE